MKMTHLLSLGIISSVALVPLSASAQMSQPPELRAYLGAGLGYYRLNDDDFLDENDRMKDNRTSWRAFAGLEVNRIFALEVAYIDFGRTDDGIATMDADGWTLAGIAALPLTPHFAPYGKVGQLFWDRDREFGLLSSGDDGNDLYYGVGARFTLTQHADLRVEYERFALDNTDLDMASVNLQFRF